MISLRLLVDDQEQMVDIRGLFIAGWAGRNEAAVRVHVEELQTMGVSAPSTTPAFYRISASRLTTSDVIEVMGADSSGEAEYVLLMLRGELYVGIGSDHTDRKVEVIGVTLSKQMCDKPLGKIFWRYKDLAPHWDKLRLRSFRTSEGVRENYQDGSVAELLPPEVLLEKFGVSLPEGHVMFCGTVAVTSRIRGAEEFEVELFDPILGRSLHHKYHCVSFPEGA